MRNPAKTTDVSVTVLVPRAEHQQFVKLCKDNDTTQSREIRRMIREFLKARRQGTLDL